MFANYLRVNEYKSSYDCYHYDIDENALIIRNFDKVPIKLKSLPQKILCGLTCFICKNIIILILLFIVIMIVFFVISYIGIILYSIFNGIILFLFLPVSGIIAARIIFPLFSPLFCNTILFNSYVCGFFKDSDSLVFNVAKNFRFYNIRLYDNFYEYSLSDITKISCSKSQYILPESLSEGVIDYPRHIVFKKSIGLIMEEKKIIINLYTSTSNDIFDDDDFGKRISKFLNVEYIVIGDHHYGDTTLFRKQTYYIP